MMRYLSILFPVLLLAACASSSMNYYRLAAQNPPEQGMPITSSTVHGQIVLDIRLPDYLNTANIVYQHSDVGISMAQSNLWAEAPEPAIARVLINDLAKREPQAIWMTDDTTVNYHSATIRISLDQFNGRHDGRAIISGQWLIRNARQQLLGVYPISIEVTQEGDGYDALVKALNQGIHQLAEQISTQLQPIIWWQ